MIIYVNEDVLHMVCNLFFSFDYHIIIIHNYEIQCDISFF
jgi:hypothetical protein